MDYDLSNVHKQVMTFLDSEGKQMQIEIVRIIPSERENKMYLVYTDVMSEKKDSVTLYIVILNENGNELTVNFIESDEEYQYALTLLKKQL